MPQSGVLLRVVIWTLHNVTLRIVELQFLSINHSIDCSVFAIYNDFRGEQYEETNWV